MAEGLGERGVTDALQKPQEGSPVQRRSRDPLGVGTIFLRVEPGPGDLGG